MCIRDSLKPLKQTAAPARRKARAGAGKIQPAALYGIEAATPPAAAPRALSAGTADSIAWGPTPPSSRGP
eukprot:6217013-Alexandrium_andersonii.AAC.1